MIESLSIAVFILTFVVCICMMQIHKLKQRLSEVTLVQQQIVNQTNFLTTNLKQTIEYLQTQEIEKVKSSLKHYPITIGQA